MTTVHFNGEILTVNKKSYNNGRIALQLTDEEGLPYMKATINMPTVDLSADDHTIIKNYAENEGILEALIIEGIVEPTGKRIQSGFVQADIVKVLI